MDAATAVPKLPDANAIKSKGYTITGALAFVDQRYGPATRARVIAALDPETRGLAERAILASEWVPLRHQVALYEAIDRTLGSGDFKLCFEIGRFTCDYEMTTINRIFLKFGSLEQWMRMGSRMWSRYYNAGRLDVEGFTKAEGTIVIREFNPISRAFCNDFAGWLHRTSEAGGARNVTMDHPACLLDGAPGCLYVGRWQL
jgi:hypothetical protein